MNDAPARLDSLTWLRFVAALLVFVHHANHTEAGATLGSALDRLSQVSGSAVVDIVSWLRLVCPVTRLPEFLLGVLLALEVRNSSWSVAVVPAAGLVAAALALTASVGRVLGEHWVALAPFGLLLVACARRDASGAGTLLGSRVMIRLGEWSFGSTSSISW